MPRLFGTPFTRRVAAMPRSEPLSCLEAEVSRLTGALALRERDIARLMSRLKSSEAQIWVLRRRNSVLAAAQEKRSCTIAAITCQSSWSKQATVLESFCARWQLGDLPELFLRVLQRPCTWPCRCRSSCRCASPGSTALRSTASP